MTGSASGGRKLDIVLRSAAGLKKVSSSRMAAYAVAWMNPSMRVPSPADARHGRNPEWNATLSLTLDDRTLTDQPRLHIELLGRGLVTTRPIGFVTVDLTDILLQASHGAAVTAPFHDHPVRRRSGRQHGILNFELCLQASTSTTQTPGNDVMQEEDDVTSTSSRSTSSPSPPPPAERQSYRRESVSMASAPPAPQQHRTYRRESVSMASAPPLPQYYEHEPHQQQMKKSSRNSSRRDGTSYGFALPMATTNSRGPVSNQDEISLLHSSY